MRSARLRSKAIFAASGEAFETRSSLVPAILNIENLVVNVEGLRIIDNLSLRINEGELHCIIGPNGAGKSTLLDVICGTRSPEEGRVVFGESCDLLALKGHQIARAGVGRKFQKPTVFENHTVFENLELALRTRKGILSSFTLRHSAQEIESIEAILETVNLRDQRNRPARVLSHGQKQWLELGMLLAQKPKLFLLDEPIAGMTEREIEHTAELLLRLANEHSLVVVEHDMAFVRSIAKRVTVLHQGKVLAQGSMEEIQEDPRVIAVYLGSDYERTND